MRCTTRLTSRSVITTSSEAAFCCWVASEIWRATRDVSPEALAQVLDRRRPPARERSSTRRGLLAPFLGGHDGGADRARELVEQAAHRLDRLLRAVGEVAHLLGDHREAPAVRPGRRGLDGGVERQDVGLLGDLGDQVEHAVDLLGAGAQGVGAVGDGADPLAAPPRPRSTASSTASRRRPRRSPRPARRAPPGARRSRRSARRCAPAPPWRR